KVTAEQARNMLEPLGKKHPDNSNFAEWLALAYAELGEKDLALQEAERGTMVLPSAKDAVDGRGTDENVPLVQTSFGEHSSAIAGSAGVKSPSGPTSIKTLRGRC